jgi:hypothetical protein
MFSSINRFDFNLTLTPLNLPLIYKWKNRESDVLWKKNCGSDGTLIELKCFLPLRE